MTIKMVDQFAKTREEYNFTMAKEGPLTATTVRCPVLGDLPRNECLDYQKRPFAATNPQRVRLYRACRACPNRETHKGVS